MEINNVYILTNVSNLFKQEYIVLIKIFAKDNIFYLNKQ